MAASAQTQHHCHHRRESRTLPEESVADVGRQVAAADRGERGGYQDPGEVLVRTSHPSGSVPLPWG